jgi:hypothetical protein
MRIKRNEEQGKQERFPFGSRRKTRNGKELMIDACVSGFREGTPEGSRMFEIEKAPFERESQEEHSKRPTCAAQKCVQLLLPQLRPRR